MEGGKGLRVSDVVERRGGGLLEDGGSRNRVLEDGGVVQDDVKKMAILALMSISATNSELGSHLAHKVDPPVP